MPNKNAYTMEVGNTVTKLTETVTMMDEKATYTISGNKNLKIGENTVTITTVAQDGKTSLEYTIIVTKIQWFLMICDFTNCTRISQKFVSYAQFCKLLE